MAHPPLAVADPTDVRLRALLELAWPVVIARSAQAVIGFSDALMSAPLGESSLAAVTTGSINTYTVMILPLGLVFIAQSFAAQLAGRGRLDNALRYAWYGMIISAATALVALGTIPFIPEILGLFEYAPEVHTLMASYLQIRMLSVGAAVATEALGNWYGGLGNTRLHMIAAFITMVVNVFLNWVLIHGNLGAPALGVDGAALASVLATIVGFLAMFALFASKVGVDLPSIRPRNLSTAELLRMIRFGLPHGVNWFMEFSAFVLFINAVVGSLGTTVLAALMVVFNINSVSFMPAFGLATSGSILSGQAIGRGAHDEVKRALWLTMRVALVWQGTIGLIYLLFPQALMTLFASGESSADLVKIGAVMLAISAAWQLFDAVVLTVGETLRAAGDTAWTMWVRLIVAWAFFMPASYWTVSGLDGGYVAAMSCVIGYVFLLAVLLGWRFLGGAWRSIDLTGMETEIPGLALAPEPLVAEVEDAAG